MPELTFVGAAGTVTGSKHLLRLNGKSVFVDCGLFQGTADVEALNSVPLPIKAAEVDSVVITHGHMDHVGYLPKLVKDGFRGSIYTTPATRDVMRIVLEDAAHLQQHLRKRGFDHERPPAPPPFYDQDDVQRTIQQTKTIELETPFDVAGVKAVYKNAGHIIGSAFVEFTIDGRSIVFSGDVGRYGRPLLPDPAPIGRADVLVCESTYGDRVHPADAIGPLADTLTQAAARGSAVVIPAFAVERAQEILLAIATIQRQNSKLDGIPIFLDSPMAAAVDEVFEKFSQAHNVIAGDASGTPFGCRNLSVLVTSEQSKALNHLQGPHVIVAASGMASGGRILYHLHNHIPDPKATILFVGFQAAGTLGFYMTHGAQTIRLFGDVLPVKAQIGVIHGFSAHADRNEIAQWFKTCDGKPSFYAVHGDPVAAQALCDQVKAQFGWTNAQVAARGETVTI